MPSSMVFYQGKIIIIGLLCFPLGLSPPGWLWVAASTIIVILTPSAATPSFLGGENKHIFVVVVCLWYLTHCHQTYEVQGFSWCLYYSDGLCSVPIKIQWPWPHLKNTVAWGKAVCHFPLTCSRIWICCFQGHTDDRSDFKTNKSFELKLYFQLYSDWVHFRLTGFNSDWLGSIQTDEWLLVLNAWAGSHRLYGLVYDQDVYLRDGFSHLLFSLSHLFVLLNSAKPPAE